MARPCTPTAVVNTRPCNPFVSLCFWPHQRIVNGLPQHELGRIACMWTSDTKRHEAQEHGAARGCCWCGAGLPCAVLRRLLRSQCPFIQHGLSHCPRCICRQLHHSTRPRRLEHVASTMASTPYGELRANVAIRVVAGVGVVGVCGGVRAPGFRKRLPTCVRRIGSNAFTSPNWPAGSVRARKKEI